MPEQYNIAMLSIHSCPAGRLGGRDTGGMNVYVKELAQELGRLGHKVDIYTRDHYGEVHDQVVKLADNVRLIHIETGYAEEIPKLAIYASLQRILCGIENFRKSNDLHYDVIHSHYWLSGMAGEQLKTWWNIPHLVMFHTLGEIKNRIGIGEEESELRIESEREVIRDCTGIIAATDREKQDLINYYEASHHKISVVPCGVNMDFFRPMDRDIAREELELDHRKVILFVGRIDPLKGLRQLLLAVPQMPETMKPVILIVGGDEYSQGEVNALQKLGQDLRIEDQLRFVGTVSQDKLPLYYSAADICVVPSYYESFGMVALEALACGTPVVATDVGGMRAIIRDGESGYVIHNNSPDLLHKSISGLLSNRTNGNDRDRIRSGIAAFSWPALAEAILSEYGNITGSRAVLAS